MEVLRDRSIHPHRGRAKPHVEMPGSIIRNNPKLETAQMPNNRCMDKQILVPLSEGTLVSNKKE